MADSDQFGRYNRRRYVMLIVVLFVVVLSFFAGKWYSRRNNVIIRETPAQGPATSSQAPTDDRAGIPPDSLHH